MAQEEYDHNYWSALWSAARRNVGSAKKLRLILGYKLERKTSASQHVHTATLRGDRPRDPERRRRLEALAGPHSATILKVLEIQGGSSGPPEKTD